MTERIEKTAAFVRRKLAEKTAYVEDVLIKLESHLAAEFATGTATASGGTGNVQAGNLLELAGRM